MANTPDQIRPLVWALTTGRVGDDAQVMVAAEATGGDVKTIDIRFNRWREAPNNLMGASLRSVVDTSELSAPWPDIVIGAGRRSVPAAMWIKEQSGGMARLIRLGRPRAPLHWFDLVITTPQYGLPKAANVMHISLPLMASPIEQAFQRHAVVAVFGGDSWTCRVTPKFAQAFAGRLEAKGQQLKAQTKVSTSPRTPSMVALALIDALSPSVETHLWRAGESGPYRSWLGQARACLVTGDSVSGITDAIMTGSPVTIVTPPPARWLALARTFGGAPLRRWFDTGGNNVILAPPPNIDGLIGHLVNSGCAERIDADAIEVTGAADVIGAEHDEARARIRTLADM